MCHGRVVSSLSLILAAGWLQVADASPSGPVIALHAKSHTTKGVTICSTGAPSDIDCTEFTTAAHTGVPYDVYVVGVNPIVEAGASGPTVAGLRWSVDYNGQRQSGVDVYSWISCGDLEFPQDGWPEPRRGNSLTWDITDRCQTNQPGPSGVQAIAGAFYVYAYNDDVFSVAPFYRWLTENGQWVGWREPEIELINCTPRVDPYYVDLATGRSAVKFSAAGIDQGFNPCTGEGVLPPYGPPDPPISPPPPPAGDHHAAILLHVGLPGEHGGTCADAPSAWDSVKTSAPYSTPGTLYNVYLLATPEAPHDPVGITGIQVGIEYSEALEVNSWISCAAQVQSTNWPASGTGNTLVFDGCQSGDIEVAGFFQVAIYDPAVFKVIGHPNTGVAKWADCSHEQVFTDLSQAQVGWISLGGAAIGQDSDGCNPALELCAQGPVPGQKTTWGKLKSKY